MSPWVEAACLIVLRRWRAIGNWAFYHDERRLLLLEEVRARKVESFSRGVDVAIKLKGAGFNAAAEQVVGELTSATGSINGLGSIDKLPRLIE